MSSYWCPFALKVSTLIIIIKECLQIGFLDHPFFYSVFMGQGTNFYFTSRFNLDQKCLNGINFFLFFLYREMYARN